MKKIFLLLIFVLTTNLIFGWKQSTHKLLSAYACINSKLIKENLMWKFNLDMGAAQPLTVENETKTVVERISNIKLFKIENFFNRNKLILGGRK